MSESQGYKLGMNLGLSDKGALFDAIRKRGTAREVELLMGNGSANTAFRRGLKSAAFELKQGKRRPATRKKTTRQRLTTAKRPAAKRKRTSSRRTSSSRKSSRPKYFSEKQVLAWFDKIPRKIGRYQPYDSKAGWTTKEDMTSEERKDLAVWYASAGPDQAFGTDIPDSDDVWVLSQEYRDSPFVLSANDGSGQRFSGTLAQMKKKLASISRRKRKNPEVSGTRFDRSGARSRTGLARRGSEGLVTARDRRRSEDRYVKSLRTMLAELKAERAKADLPSYLIDFYDMEIAELEEELASYGVKPSRKTPRRKKGRRKRKNPRRRDSMGRFV